MRFMMLMIPKVYQSPQKAGPELRPNAEMVEKMMKYNEELAKAGALLSLDGLHPPVTGARVSFSKGKTTVTDGPFAESKEALGGFWMVQMKSKQEAIDWARRCPAEEGDVIELRQVFEMSDFPPDVQKAGENPTVAAVMRKS